MFFFKLNIDNFNRPCFKIILLRPSFRKYSSHLPKKKKKNNINKPISMLYIYDICRNNDFGY